MTIKLFITGTDTEVGKTYISIGILKACNQLGLSTIGCKPISSGGFDHGDKILNHDALSLQRTASLKLSYEKINPLAFKPAIAPHIAAAQSGDALSLLNLNKKIKSTFEFPADICVVEGVGGWYAPLNEIETMADFALYHQLKVILVVGIRVGCINHAILTSKAIQHDKANIIGWIANCIDENMACRDENIATLKKWLPTPCLGIVGYKSNAESFIDADTIIKLSSY